MEFSFLGNPTLSFAISLAMVFIAFLMSVALVIEVIENALKRRKLKSCEDTAFDETTEIVALTNRWTWLFCGWLAVSVILFYASIGPATDHWDRQEEIDRIALLLSHPNTSPEKLMDAAQSNEKEWKLAAAQHRHLPDEGILLLAKDRSKDVKLVIAGRTDAPVEALQLLIADPYSPISKMAIRNVSLPADLVNMEIMDGLTDNP